MTARYGPGMRLHTAPRTLVLALLGLPASPTAPLAAPAAQPTPAQIAGEKALGAVKARCKKGDGDACWYVAGTYADGVKVYKNQALALDEAARASRASAATSGPRRVQPWIGTGRGARRAARAAASG